MPDCDKLDCCGDETFGFQIDRANPDPPVIPTYSLTLDVDPEASGTVTGAGDWEQFSLVTITATPAENYQFISWSGDYVGTSPSVQIYMDTTKVIQANFALKTFTVTLISNPPGGATFTGAGVYSYGATATITAIPATNYAFDDWSGGITSINNPENVTVTSDLIITANLHIPDYVLAITVDPIGGGTATGADTYPAGEIVSIQAFPADGYEFANWSGDASSTDNPLEVTITANTNIVANFAGISYDLVATANPPEGGVVLGSGSYSANATAGVLVTPNAGYDFAGWAGDLTGNANPTTILMDGDKTVLAVMVYYNTEDPFP